MSTVEGDSVERAYQTVEDMLKGAVTSSSDPKAFQSNLQFCQIVAQRLLAVLIFNAGQNGQDIDQSLEKVGMGIKRELNDLVEASKAPGQMTSIEVDFPTNSSDDGKTDAKH